MATAEQPEHGAPEPPGAVTLPPSFYTSAEHYDVERERLLWTSWVSVARVEDVASPGDYVTYDFAGEPVLVVRGRDGVLRAFPNVCRHRPTTIMDGCGNARSLQCPYHLWTYDLAGRLIGAPDMDGIEGFAREDWCLPELGIETWGGWVFVHLEKDAPPLADAIRHLEATYPGAFLEPLVRVGSSKCRSPWNWKIVVENFIESYHHAGVHPKLLQVPYPYQKIDEVDPRGEWWGSIEHTPNTPGLEPFSASSLYPTHLFALQRPFGLVWFKLEIPGHDAVEIDMQAFAMPELAENDAVGAQFMEILEAVNAEDLFINAKTWKGMHSRFAKMGPMSPYEEGLRHFRRFVRAKMGMAG